MLDQLNCNNIIINARKFERFSKITFSSSWLKDIYTAFRIVSWPWKTACLKGKSTCPRQLKDRIFIIYTDTVEITGTCTCNKNLYALSRLVNTNTWDNMSCLYQPSDQDSDHTKQHNTVNAEQPPLLQHH